MTSLQDRFGETIRVLDAPLLPYAGPGGPYRCSRGSPYGVIGELSSAVRLLVAGCMLTSDASYSADAEIHIPAMCTQPADCRPGCMVPGATNYDINAVQPAHCAFPGVSGCTSPTAINYQWDADTDDGSCIEAHWGCTIHPNSYYGVPVHMPGYQSSTFGSPARGVGLVPFPEQPVVKNYDPLANSLSGCQFVIEGCMDPSAVNYNSHATANSNTWCIPASLGCMMPPATAAQACALSPSSSHCRDRFSANFDPAATIDEGCVAARLGCTSSTALNYDSFATQDDDCYEPTAGCLDRRALNFRCATPGTAACHDRVSVHTPGLCTFFLSPPSPPAVPPPPPGTYFEIYTIKNTIVVAGDIADWTEERRLALRVKYATLCAVNLADVTLVVTDGSVILTVTITAQDAAAQASIMTLLQPHMASVDAASAFLGEQVLMMPTVVSETILQLILSPPSAPADKVDIALFSGVIFGGVGFLIVIIFMYWYCRYYLPNSDIKVVPEPASSTTGGWEKTSSTTGGWEKPSSTTGGWEAPRPMFTEDYGGGVAPALAQTRIAAQHT